MDCLRLARGVGRWLGKAYLALDSAESSQKLAHRERPDRINHRERDQVVSTGEGEFTFLCRRTRLFVLVPTENCVRGSQCASSAGSPFSERTQFCISKGLVGEIKEKRHFRSRKANVYATGLLRLSGAALVSVV